MARPLKELEAKLPQIGQVISNGSLGQIFKVANMGGMRYSGITTSLCSFPTTP